MPSVASAILGKPWDGGGRERGGEGERVGVVYSYITDLVACRPCAICWPLGGNTEKMLIHSE